VRYGLRSIKKAFHSMTYEDIAFDISAGVASIILNRPDDFNGMTRQMRGELTHAITHAGANARDVFLLQKFDRVLPMLTGVIAETRIEKLTMIDGRAPGVQGDGLPMRAMGTVEQVKELFGVDLAERLKALGAPTPRS